MKVYIIFNEQYNIFIASNNPYDKDYIFASPNPHKAFIFTSREAATAVLTQIKVEFIHMTAFTQELVNSSIVECTKIRGELGIDRMKSVSIK